MAGKAPAHGRKPAGKHRPLRPKATLRPKASTPVPVPKVTKQARVAKQTKKDRRSNKNPWQTATRRILTRSQTKVFRLLDLPAELRNLVYHHAAASFSDEQALDLETVAIPPDLSLSRQVRSEAVPFFFSATHFKVSVVSNYCVFRRHFHYQEHVRYHQAGIMALPELLTQGSGDDRALATAKSGDDVEIGLREEMVRFKHVTFELDCVCCTPGKTIAKLELGVQGTRAVVDCAMLFLPKDSDKTTEPSLELIFEDVRSVVEEIGKREGFNGFTVADLVAVAACASHGRDEAQESQRGDEH